MTKQIKINQRPILSGDEWVKNKLKIQTKKICISIPLDIHRRIKTACVDNGTKMQDAISELIMKKYGEK